MDVFNPRHFKCPMHFVYDFYNKYIIISLVITGDARESNFLFQQLSVALQRGNAVSFQNTFTAS